MLFKEMKPGYPVYFLDKENVKAYQGKVVSVAVPRYDAPKFGQIAQPQTGMVVDVTIEANGEAKTYTIPEATSVAYAGMVVLSSDKDGILREVEALKSEAEATLSKMETAKANIGRCDAILEEWNPQIAEKRENERRIEGIENEVKSLGQMVREFINEFKRG